MSVARVRDLRVAGPGGPLVGSLDLDVAAGERIGLVGRSGAGKSLTAAALAGLLPPPLVASGEVSITPGATGRGVGIVLQESALALNPLVRVGPQLGLPLRATCSAAERRRRVVTMLERLGLPEDVHDRWPMTLSGGQRQRVAVGLAMISPPALLVADEPTSALDPPTQRAVLDLLVDLVTEAGTALLLISHDLALVSSACTRVLVMADGRVCEEGTTGDVLEHPQHAASQELVRAAHVLGVTA